MLFFIFNYLCITYILYLIQNTLSIYFDKKFDYRVKGKVASLAEDFLITKAKTKPKQKTIK